MAEMVGVEWSETLFTAFMYSRNDWPPMIKKEGA
jgi:hypothetical protein